MESTLNFNTAGEALDDLLVSRATNCNGVGADSAFLGVVQPEDYLREANSKRDQEPRMHQNSSKAFQQWTKTALHPLIDAQLTKCDNPMANTHDKTSDKVALREQGRKTAARALPESKTELSSASHPKTKAVRKQQDTLKASASRRTTRRQDALEKWSKESEEMMSEHITPSTVAPSMLGKVKQQTKQEGKQTRAKVMSAREATMSDRVKKISAPAEATLAKQQSEQEVKQTRATLAKQPAQSTKSQDTAGHLINRKGERLEKGAPVVLVIDNDGVNVKDYVRYY